jgi:hypothetical protein
MGSAPLLKKPERPRLLDFTVSNPRTYEVDFVQRPSIGHLGEWEGIENEFAAGKSMKSYGT